MKNNEYDEIKNKVMSTKSFIKQRSFSADIGDDKVKIAINIFNKYEKEFSNCIQGRVNMCCLIILFFLDLMDLVFIEEFCKKLGVPYENLCEDLLAAKIKIEGGRNSEAIKNYYR